MSTPNQNYDFFKNDSNINPKKKRSSSSNPSKSAKNSSKIYKSSEISFSTSFSPNTNTSNNDNKSKINISNLLNPSDNLQTSQIHQIPSNTFNTPVSSPISFQSRHISDDKTYNYYLTNQPINSANKSLSLPNLRTNLPAVSTPPNTGTSSQSNYQFVDPHRYPTTYQLLHDSNIDKSKKKKGGFRCSGPNCPNNCNFTNILDLARHLDELRAFNDFKCDQTGCVYKYIGFNTSGSLKRHRKTHVQINDNDAFKCEHCQKVFRTCYNKTRHVQSTHPNQSKR